MHTRGAASPAPPARFQSTRDAVTVAATLAAEHDTPA
jgi:hypothetical protein